jgi:3-methyladenine DNA glycosylase/8-oxoguanine DNA glycosylase
MAGPAFDTAPIETRFRPRLPVDLRATFGAALRWPTATARPDGVWRATRTPDGPATVRYRGVGRDVVVQAWGPGAARAIADAATTIGAGDDLDGFDATRHPLVRELHRRNPGLRMPRTGAVLEALVPAVFDQKVQSGQARRAFAALVRRYGEPAPGEPARRIGLRLLPSPADLGRIPVHAFHPLNVEAKRAITVIRGARLAPRLEECAAMALPAAYARLRSVPGIGPWTAAEVGAVAFGDPDAVSVGDFHLPNTIAWALAGEPRADDARMLELLEPFAGHRGRVVKLVERAGMRAPRYGPRLSLHDIRAL